MLATAHRVAATVQRAVTVAFMPADRVARYHPRTGYAVAAILWGLSMYEASLATLGPLWGLHSVLVTAGFTYAAYTGFRTAEADYDRPSYVVAESLAGAVTASLVVGAVEPPVVATTGSLSADLVLQYPHYLAALAVYAGAVVFGVVRTGAAFGRSLLYLYRGPKQTPEERVLGEPLDETETDEQ